MVRILRDILELRNIHKSFPGTKVLQDVHFTLRKGEIHALIGENGAGKSTLMNILMGIHQPSEGTIVVRGEKQVITSPSKAQALGIGMVPQELNLVPQATVAENIFLGMERLSGRFPRIAWQKMRSEAEQIMARLGVRIDVDAPAGSLSAAYQQLVQIARALAFEADILIFDEPTASLTIKEAERLFGILTQLKNEQRSIIYISHHLEEIKRIADRVSVMRDGRLVVTGETSGMSVDEMIRHMIGKDMEQIHVKRRPDTAGRKELLRVERLSRKKEFRDVSFHIDEGEILGIAGLVGAGRTELANAIFGVSKPDEGEMYWEGRKIHIGSQRDAIGIGIGYVPEERRRLGIFPVLSVTENLTMPLLSAVLKWSGIDSSRERKLIHRYIGELKIKTSSPDKQIRLLSGGNQQKVILARWLAKKVKLLILDEPTRGIDVGAKREIHELIRKLAAEGMSVLLISSELEEVIQLSDRIMVLHEGRVKGFFDAAEVTKEQLLSTALA